MDELKNNMKESLTRYRETTRESRKRARSNSRSRQASQHRQSSRRRPLASRDAMGHVTKVLARWIDGIRQGRLELNEEYLYSLDEIMSTFKHCHEESTLIDKEELNFRPDMIFKKYQCRSSHLGLGTITRVDNDTFRFQLSQSGHAEINRSAEDTSVSSKIYPVNPSRPSSV